MKTLNLDELEKEYHTVTLAGVSYRVRPVTGRITSMIAAAEQAEGIDKMRVYYDIVALLVPGMQRDDVEDLSSKQLAGIMSLASTAVDAVEEAANPNAASPAKATPGEGSAPVAITSAASS